MTATKCCSKPCLVPDWARKLYGHQCTNCRTFTPGDGSASFKVPVRQ
jgi:hypothetical protein